MDETLFDPQEDFPFDQVLEALLDQENILDPLHLYRLSDLAPANQTALGEIWERIDLDRRRALVEDLEQLSDTNNLLSFEPVFRLAMQDDDEQVRFFAIRAIEIFDTDDLIPYFLEVVQGKYSVDLRAVTASVLGKYVYRGELDKISSQLKTEIEDCLLDVLTGEQPGEIQRRALEAISYSSREEVREHILEAYQNGTEDWVASSLFAMGRSYDHDYSELVQDKLGDTSPLVRVEAVRACGELSIEDAIPVILDLLNDLPDIRETAIWALSMIGGEEAGPAIHELLEDEISPEEEELIQQALERLDFLEDGIETPLFDLAYGDDDLILDDYDYQQDGYDDYDRDGLDGLDHFDFDDDLWLE